MSIAEKSVKARRVRDAQPEFNCEDCYFQGTEKTELQKHINLKHRVNSKADGSIKCRNCGKMFETKHDLMNHRKKDHSSSVAPCKNYLIKNCTFSAELCWWNHSEKEDQTIECFVCGNKFDSKSSMMNHR